MKRSDSQYAIVHLTSRLNFTTSSLRNILGLPSSRCTSMHMPRLENPADSPHPHQLRMLHLDFEYVTALVSRNKSYFRGDASTSGSRLSLWPTHFSVYASPVLFVRLFEVSFKRKANCDPYELRHRRNTRYGWVVSPFPTGTFTLQGAPSFAWRTNACLNWPRGAQQPRGQN